MGYGSQASAIVDHAFLKNLYNGIAGYGAESGLTLSVTGASMVVTIASGVAHTATARTVYAGGTLTPAVGDATNPRMDAIIWDDSANAPAVLAGTPTALSASQTRPPLTDLADPNDLVLGVIYIPAAATVILSANVFDRRTAVTVLAIPEIVNPLIAAGVDTTATQTRVANTAYFLPIEPITAPTTVTALQWAHNIASGNYDIGIYSFDGTTMTRVVSLGSTASPAIGATRVTSDITDTILYPGVRYFFGWACDNGVESVYMTLPAASAPTNVGWLKATSFPLPASATTLTAAPNPTVIRGQVSGGITL